MAITLNFLIPRLMPGDPASIMFAQFKGILIGGVVIFIALQVGLLEAFKIVM